MTFYALCPFCQVRVDFRARKDSDSFTRAEMRQHVKDAHPAKAGPHMPYYSMRVDNP